MYRTYLRLYELSCCCPRVVRCPPRTAREWTNAWVSCRLPATCRTLLPRVWHFFFAEIAGALSISPWGALPPVCRCRTTCRHGMSRARECGFYGKIEGKKIQEPSRVTHGRFSFPFARCLAARLRTGLWEPVVSFHTAYTNNREHR